MTSSAPGQPDAVIQAPTPLGFATAATHRFVRSHIPSPETGRVRVLEVGCGAGVLAARLVADGYDVVALDASDDAISQARTAGVDARVAAWPDFDVRPDGDRFDAVLFTRSLHHIHPLGPALDRARDVLAPNGRVLVEDFAIADVDRPTAAWFYSIVSLLDAAGSLDHRPGEFATRLIEGGGTFELWHDDHDHEITSATEMREALVERFDVSVEMNEPYLYRYVCPLLSDDERGARIAARIYERERAIAQERVVKLIGRRYVAQPVSR